TASSRPSGAISCCRSRTRTPSRARSAARVSGGERRTREIMWGSHDDGMSRPTMATTWECGLKSQNIIIEQFTLLTDCAIGKIIRLGASEFPLFNFYSTQNILFALWNSGMSTACENAQTEIVLTESIMFDCLRAQTKTESLCLFLKLAYLVHFTAWAKTCMYTRSLTLYGERQSDVRWGFKTSMHKRREQKSNILNLIIQRRVPIFILTHDPNSLFILVQLLLHVFRIKGTLGIFYFIVFVLNGKPKPSLATFFKKNKGRETIFYFMKLHLLDRFMVDIYELIWIFDRLSQKGLNHHQILWMELLYAAWFDYTWEKSKYSLLSIFFLFSGKKPQLSGTELTFHIIASLIFSAL
ncbi:hypothetical protein ACJX0J_017258, partial [Zea mays]